jgi:hypothetical protein
MSTREHIFLAVDDDPEAVADWMASLLAMTVEHFGGEPYVYGRAYTAEGEIGGRVRRNVVADPDPRPEEESLTDYFPVMVDINYTGRDEGTQFEEAKRLFADLAIKSSTTMALLRGFDTLVAVYTKESGLVLFPPGTSADVEDRDAWLPYRPSPR